jgi:hypothetical protein
MAMASAERRGMGFCPLATSLDPHTALFNRGAADLAAPVRARCGCGAAHRNHQDRSPDAQEREHASHHTCRVRAQDLGAPRRAPTPAVPHDSARWPGSAHRDPVRRQARLLPSLRSGDTSP